MTKLFIKPVDRLSRQPIDIDAVEETYNGTYVGDFCIKQTSGSWTETPIAIFYQPNPKVELGHTHYFGIYVSHQNQVFIMDGQSAFEDGITGAIADNGEVIFSRFRHHFTTSQDGSISIDGGRDYTKLVGKIDNATSRIVKLVINKDKLEIDPTSIVLALPRKLDRITTLTGCL